MAPVPQGARQTGKTSVLRHAFPNAAYLTLDLPAAAQAAVSAPEELLDKLPEPLIISVIQCINGCPARIFRKRK
ncbi:MAG: hypothetical protein QHJ82_06310 [Verrucomicrobiota bacterium]|nr:hypothetical protein [Verrucomicrobiota bacterium]